MRGKSLAKHWISSHMNFTPSHMNFSSPSELWILHLQVLHSQFQPTVEIEIYIYIYIIYIYNIYIFNSRKFQKVKLEFSVL